MIRLATLDAATIADEALIAHVRNAALRRRSVAECMMRARATRAEIAAIDAARAVLTHHCVAHDAEHIEAIATNLDVRAENYRAIAREHRAAIRQALKTAMDLA